MSQIPEELDLGRTSKYLGRALKLRCAHCGRGRMFRNWLRQQPKCTTCGLAFDRHEPDYFIGAYVVNLIVAEFVVVAGMLVGMYATWPDVPWNRMKWLLLPVALVAPLITYPFSKSIWLAIDLIYRPASQTDFIEPVS